MLAWSARDLLLPPRQVRVVPVLATAADVQRQGTPLFKAAGWVEPRPTPVRVAALAPGVIEKLLVVEDQAVEQNAPIAQLVEDDARLAVERAQADSNLREAELAAARAEQKAAQTRLKKPVHLDAALAEAQAALAKIETELKNLPFAVQRAEAELTAAQRVYSGKLAAQDAVAGVEIDIAKSKLDSAQALLAELRRRESSLDKEYQALASRRDALQTQRTLLADEIQAMESATAKVSSALARVEQERVALAEAQLQLDRMTVRAPITGRVYRLVAQPGTRLGGASGHGPGQDGSTVVTLYRPDLLQLRVDVRFEDIPKIQLQQPVRIENAALPAPITGHVLFVSSEADIQKNTLQVKVAIPDPPAMCKPEMLMDVTFLAVEKQGETAGHSGDTLQLYVPQQLIQQDADGPFVWLADQSEGVARKIIVETGSLSTDGLLQVTRGLTNASRLIASGFEDLADGDRIQVVGEDPSLGTDVMVQRSAADGSRKPERGGAE